MRRDFNRIALAGLVVVIGLLAVGTALAQQKQGPVVNSPEVLSDGKVVFRILAPKAEKVALNASDIQGLPRGGPQFTKGENGVWEATIGPIDPGAYRYTFLVDEVSVVDPRNPSVSESNNNVWSLVYVPGAKFMEAAKVPHGAVAEISYYSTALGRNRRMHIYTPPAYETGQVKYPVFYLLHGAMDCDDSWSTVGRAGYILDNLIAEKKAKPMIVVMPSGWTPSGGQVMTSDATKDPFTAEMIKDIIPFIEANYRVVANPENRALSGLSMGGIQTLNIGLHHLGTFRYVAVMSSGWISDTDREFFYKAEEAQIPKYNSELKLFWWGWGETDIARANGLAVIGKFRSAGVKIETMETPGGHEWANWRLYLHEVAPKLFR